ncbi:flotillin family protein [Burkholderia cenocepacia]|uniref:flotillin family protein n=1 Tax=Burkholderia cenocepacia TaxID=95486 RepID=UPI0007622186|nr:flotillin domain-containing protein [Burkholderia cenocepacia]KWU19080.1 hypothetical protein AS149_12600 [Burkholderia cenocepacia]
MASLISAGIGIIGIVVAILVIGFILARLYTKVDAEKAFVRTGAGNRKVVMNGGALVLPVFHSITWVNLKTLRLTVQKKEDHSLVTGDKLRIDVDVDFFVRVGSSADAVSTAAQTLGAAATDAVALSRQVEAKFVDALRTVAATMTLNELHQQRHQFVQQVQQAVAPDLAKNGLEMESVSLTSLNQTAKKFFDVDNVLDAEGLTALTTVTEQSKQRINDIEQTNQVAIEQRNLEAAQKRAEIKRQTAEVSLKNEQEIATTTAERKASIAATEAEGRRKAEEAAIEADQQIQTRRVESNKAVKEAETKAETAIRLAAQDQAITVANRSKDEAKAAAEANEARALAVASEEAVITARETEIATREKQVAVIAAEKRAQQESIGVVVAAEAERNAAANRADALRVEAEGERDAAVARADGIRAQGLADAEALFKKNEAQNSLSPEVVAQQVKLALIERMPELIAAAVAPLQKIESIRIAAVNGLGGAGGTGQGNGAVAGTNNSGMADQVVQAALSYQYQKPVIDGLLAEVGLKPGTSLDSLVASTASIAGLNVAPPAQDDAEVQA